VIDGLLPVDKALGWTSHDVVARLRRVAGQRSIGHAGTLDPLASGVLVLMLGSATRLSSLVMQAPKTYCAEIVLGATTVTDDGEAPLLEARDAGSIRREEVERCLQAFIGDVDQVPPRYAAVRHGGEKLYVLARKGVDVEPAPRRVHISALTLTRWDPPRFRLRIECGSGTYIRSLARDIGASLRVGAYLHALRRTSSGSFTIDRCSPLDALSDREAVALATHPMDWVLGDWPAVVLASDQVRAARHGQAVPIGDVTEGRVRLYDAFGTLVGLAVCSGDRVKPYRVFNGGH